ncbi:hypothetical protein DFJ63DRAFT_311599 [Scheffersomyces coipomensis]|uniref:uncharacterized protein n=1 Tax=Scheffersomyces coipomensis TaxID=1788519 RepID=UPI00315CBABD
MFNTTTTLPNDIQSFDCNFITNNTPNSKLPILVYRNIINKSYLLTEFNQLNESDKISLINETLLKNGWKAEQTWGAYTNTHYHYNVHEAYFITEGSSTLILGLDVNIVPEETTPELLSQSNHIEIEVKYGDLIILPAGTSHCSKSFDEKYKYIAAYPINGPKWKSISKLNLKSISMETIDGYKDIAKEVALPPNDPIYHDSKGGLVDIWNSYI